MYSLIIPAHNEAKNLSKLLKSAASVLNKLGEKFEIIIVNDNSTDNSIKILKNLKKGIKELKVINRTANPGVGFAIRDGLSNAKGDIIITMELLSYQMYLLKHLRINIILWMWKLQLII